MAFVVLEGTERIFFAGEGQVGGIHLVALGLVMQIAVALAIAAFLVGLARTVELLAKLRAVSGPRVSTPIAFVCSEIPRPRPRLLRGGRTLRGPPPLGEFR